MRVEFFVADERKRISGWTATRGKRTRVPGSAMAYGNGAPHDLVQFVIEAATGTAFGFWGLVAVGATFKSTGRKRTKPGRALIADHRTDLSAAEELANRHVAAWKSGVRSEVTRHLAAADDAWRSLRLGDTLVFDWPSPTGRIVRASAPDPRHAEVSAT